MLDIFETLADLHFTHLTVYLFFTFGNLQHPARGEVSAGNGPHRHRLKIVESVISSGGVGKRL